ncbi:uncharacterized protein V1510DRAFT_410435 [Dipodascopsis tothii]|uniref:uncharacterized protein n=1 Tax=Dipodascopsis tothii TaxID=44089 RepID=UPI0034CE883F
MRVRLRAPQSSTMLPVVKQRWWAEADPSADRPSALPSKYEKGPRRHLLEYRTSYGQAAPYRSASGATRKPKHARRPLAVGRALANSVGRAGCRILCGAQPHGMRLLRFRRHRPERARPGGFPRTTVPRMTSSPYTTEPRLTVLPTPDDSTLSQESGGTAGAGGGLVGPNRRHVWPPTGAVTLPYRWHPCQLLASLPDGPTAQAVGESASERHRVRTVDGRAKLISPPTPQHL